MRNANGMGCVVYLGKNRRKPYAARVTIGWTDEGKQKTKYIGYGKTKKEASLLLLDFNRSGVDIENYDITFKEVFEQWFKIKENKIAKSNQEMYKSAFNYSKILHNMSFKDIRTQDLEKAIYSCPKSIATKKKMKTLYNQLYAYVLKNTLANVKDFAKYIEMPAMTEDDISIKTPFSDAEIEKLWNYCGKIDCVDIVLILIYMGWRINELFNIKKEDVNLEERYMVGGSKTTAGINRIVPIHHKILPIITALYAKNKVYLIENKLGKQMKYSNFRREKWDKIMSDLEMKHLPHECRHTTATLLDRFEANSNSIKKILGHSSTNITDKTYIHKDLSQLITAIEKIEI